MSMRFPSLCLLLVVVSTQCFSESAGKVARLVPAGFINHSSETKEAKLADPVAWNDILRTNPAGRLQVSLDDGSTLTLGSHAELRVVKHDTKTKQTMLELLYGRLRARVVPISQTGGSFQVHTPTAVIGVIGTTFAVDARSSTPVQTITAEQIQNLPMHGRDFSSLADLQPGALPGTPGQLSIADYAAVDATYVYGIDRITGVRNIDPNVRGIVFLFPGEFTIVRRGQPPTQPQKAEMKDLFPDAGWPQSGISCPGYIDIAHMGDLPNAPKYKITGMGTSTGDVFKVEVNNDSACPWDIYIPSGAVLKPKGYTEKIIKSLLLGEMPPLKNFQIMMTEGRDEESPRAAAQAAGGTYFMAPESGQTSFLLRGYCLELHKLAPHQKTEYKFADPDEQEKLAPNKKIIAAAHRMLYTGQLKLGEQGLGSVIQWSLWASREGMDEKKFHEEFHNLIKKNFEAQKRKFDKDAQKRADTSSAELWALVSKVLADSR